MSFWEQFLLAQASSALHAVVSRYAGKYFTHEEQQAANIVIDALVDLPRRINSGTALAEPVAMLSVNTAKGKGK